MKILTTFILLNILAYICLIKFADHKRLNLPVSKTQTKVDQAMQNYYGKPVNFQALNKLSSAELDIIIREAGF